MNTLDFLLLEKARKGPSGKLTARCPACAETGGDGTGNHLVVFPDGRFACAAHAGDRSHRSRIMSLVGIRPDFSDYQANAHQHRQWLDQRAREQRNRIETQHLVHTARKHRQALVARYPWEPADVWEDSPQRIECGLVESCSRHFIGSLLPGDSIIWTGGVHDSGKPLHANRWNPVSVWLAAAGAIGPMTTPATWKFGTYSRSAANVLSSPYTVLDFDGFDGVKPSTPIELRDHLQASLALIRWFREFLHWRLAAIVHTGNKSLHAWFHTPPTDVLDSLKVAAQPFGIDAGLVGRPEHPCRLPGHKHEKTGAMSKLLWLQVPPW